MSVAIKEALANAKRQVAKYDTPERRALTAIQGTSPASGGYTTSDSAMWPSVAEVLKTGTPIRRFCKVITTARGGPFPYPTVDDTAVVAELLAENAAGSPADSTFGQIVLNSHSYRARVQASQEFWNDTISKSSIQAILASRIARLQNTHFTTGDGSGKPQGVVTGASSGSVTSATAIPTSDELLTLVGSLDPEYRLSPSCCLMMHSNLWRDILKALDATGQACYRPRNPLAGEQYDSFAGIRVLLCNDMLTTSTGRGVCIADLSQYIVRDVGPVEFFAAFEATAEAHQMTLRSVLRSDGKLLTSAAAKYLVLG